MIKLIFVIGRMFGKLPNIRPIYRTFNCISKHQQPRWGQLSIPKCRTFGNFTEYSAINEYSFITETQNFHRKTFGRTFGQFSVRIFGLKPISVNHWCYDSIFVESAPESIPADPLEKSRSQNRYQISLKKEPKSYSRADFRPEFDRHIT